MFRRNAFVTVNRCFLAVENIRCNCCNAKELNKIIPSSPTWKEYSERCEKTKVDPSTVKHLERMALVNFGSTAGVERLEHAIVLAEQLDAVNTVGVEPMASVLDNRELYLREDEVTEGYCSKKVLRNAAKTCEEYFVAPPGNIPLSPQKMTSESKTSSKKDNGR